MIALKQMWEQLPPGWGYCILTILTALFILALALRKPRSKRNLDAWLNQYHRKLPKRAQKKLIKLRSERRKRPRYPRNWPKTSKGIRKERPKCEVCGNKTKHIHHRRYRRFGRDRKKDLIALCDMCHYFIHPRTDMARGAFKRHRKGK